MDIERLKEYIFENDKIGLILESLGCHHIRYSSGKVICANPDGDNIGAVNIYLPDLNVVNYTRNLDSVSRYHDIFTLVQYYLDLDFFKAIGYVCDAIGISTYHDFDEDLPESIILTRTLMGLINDGEVEESDKPLKPIPEEILGYYHNCVNDMFLNDGITYDVQQAFEIGYDPHTNRITIPIRNYDSRLVGVKGRLFQETIGDQEVKYIYIEPCNKSKVLFGLDKSFDAIKKHGTCFVGESEKFVMQLFSYGDANCVSTGGKTISRSQIEMLSRLCADIILCFDKDVEQIELECIADKFIGNVNVYAIVDDKNILKDHESPSDNEEKWNRLKNECIIKIR